MGMTPDDWKREMLKAIRKREPMLQEAEDRLRQAETRVVEERPVGISLEEAKADSSDLAFARERLEREQAAEAAIRAEADAKIARYEREKKQVADALAAIAADFAAARKVAETDAALVKLHDAVAAHRDASDFDKAMDALADLRREINETRKEAARVEHLVKSEAEAKLFAELTDGFDDFDTYENVLEKTPEKIAELNAAFDAMLARSREMAAAGASLEEQKAMLAHIPENFWPDRFFAELDAWRVTEAALLEEAVTKLFDPAKEKASSTAETIEKVAETGVTIGGAATKLKPSEEGGTKQTPTDATVPMATLTEPPPKDPAFIAFLTDAREKTAMVGENLELAGELGALVAGIAGGSETERTPEEKVKIGLERTKAIASVATGILDQVAEHLESVEQLQAAKAVIDLLTGVNGPVIDMATSFIGAGEQDGARNDTSKTADERLKAQQAYEEALWKAVGAAAATGVSVTKVLLPLAGEVGTQMTPILGVPANGIAVVRSVKDLLESRALRSETTTLATEAATIDPQYTRMIEQELSQLNTSIAKSAVTAVGNTIDAVGSVTSATGAAHVGAPIAIVGKAITYGGKAVFFVVDNVHASKCQTLLEEARAGKREARKQIFSESGRYAKMFIAIGATKTPPDVIALKFIQQRGLTEADLADSSTSTYVVRQFLLTKSGEKDDHETIVDTIKKGASAAATKVGDVMNARDRSIAYGDEQKKWTYATPIRITGEWWLATEREALANGLKADAADGLQGAFSTFKSSLDIAQKTKDGARWADHYTAAGDLHRRMVSFTAVSNDDQVHVAMNRLRTELIDMLNATMKELEGRIDPEAAAAREAAVRDACSGKLQEVNGLVHELGLQATWAPKIDEVMNLIGSEQYEEALGRLSTMGATLTYQRQEQKQTQRS